MKIVFLILAASLFFSSPAMAVMYGEDDEPAEKFEDYSFDKEDPAAVQMPEIQTEMPEPIQDMKFDENDTVEKEYTEDNLTPDEFGRGSSD